jgi:2-C-methyl-D-erythritol 2,4-cyclodiphosphate synthase
MDALTVTVRLPKVVRCPIHLLSVLYAMKSSSFLLYSILSAAIVPYAAFVVGGVTPGGRYLRTITAAVSTGTGTDDLLRPSYAIEKIPLRIGHGFDIHRMAPLAEAGQPVVIGGVVIDHLPQKWTDAEGRYVEKGGVYETELGVVAHSDGDVIYHSIVDAIFGALTLPDIGQVFQDTDPRWKGCDSSKFMEHAHTVMADYGYKVGNIDVTLILERPKVASFKPAMKKNIVNLLQTTPGRVNIKARTHERVDSVGELRSLSCHVVMTLELDT